MLKKNENIFIIAGLLLLCIIFWRRFLPGYLYTGDTAFLSSTNLTAYYHTYLRYTNTHFGSVLAEVPRILINGLVGVLGNWGLHRNGSIIRLFFLLPYCLFGFLGTFYLAGLYTKNNYFRLLAGILYVINTPVIASLSMGHLHQIVPLGLFPYILYYCEKYIFLGNNFKNIYYILLLLFISSVYEFRFAYIAFLTIILYFLFYFINKKISLQSLTKVGILLGGGFIALNLYRIIPFFHIGTDEVTKLFSRGPFGNGYRDIHNGIGQFHTYRSGGLLKIFTKQTIPLLFYILPIITLIGLYNIKNKRLLFYYGMLAIGILIVKQAGLPFIYLYDWLYEHIPGFNMFREGSRFFQLISLSYAIIIAYTLEMIYKTTISSKKYKLLFYPLLGGVLLYLINIIYPIFMGINTTFFQPKFIDLEYGYVNSFFNEQQEPFKILYIPRVANLMVFDNINPGVSFVNIDLGDNTIADSNIINNSKFNQFLDNVGIKYLVLDKENVGTDNPFYRFEGKEIYKKNLVANSDIEQIYISGSDNIMLFENKGYKPLIHGSTNITYNYVNPITYALKTTLTSENNEIQLNFLQSFHPGRGIYPCVLGENNNCKNNVTRETFSESYFTTSHTKLHPTGNQRTIDRKTIMEQFPQESYTIHNDGSITVDLILYFRPQSRFYVGTIGSGVTLLSLFLLLVRDRRRRKFLSLNNTHETQ